MADNWHLTLTITYMLEDRGCPPAYYSYMYSLYKMDEIIITQRCFNSLRFSSNFAYDLIKVS